MNKFKLVLSIYAVIIAILVSTPSYSGDLEEVVVTGQRIKTWGVRSMYLVAALGYGYYTYNSATDAVESSTPEVPNNEGNNTDTSDGCNELAEIRRAHANSDLAAFLGPMGLAAMEFEGEWVTIRYDNGDQEAWQIIAPFGTQAITGTELGIGCVSPGADQGDGGSNSIQ